MLSEKPDAAVIAESGRNTAAFAIVYDRYAAELYRYAYRRVGREVAEDVVAELIGRDSGSRQLAFLVEESSTGDLAAYRPLTTANPLPVPPLYEMIET